MSGGLTRFQGTCLAFNLVVGCGFLSLPSAFAQSGWALGLGLLLFSVVLLIGTALAEAETILRVSALQIPIDAHNDNATATTDPAKLQARKGTREHTVLVVAAGTRAGSTERGYSAILNDPGDKSPTTSATLCNYPSHADDAAHNLSMALEALSTSRRTVEISEACEVLFGEKAKVAHCLVLTVYQVCTMWSYASVFGEAASGLAALPLWLGGEEDGNGNRPCDLYAVKQNGSEGELEECLALYRSWVVVFACVAIPLGCLDPKEQAVFQVFMTGLRLSVVAAMVLSVASVAAVQAASDAASLSSGVPSSGPSVQEAPPSSFHGGSGGDNGDVGSSSPSSNSAAARWFGSELAAAAYEGNAVPAARSTGVFTAFSIMVFALLMNAQLALLTSNLKHKADLKPCVVQGMLAAALTYALLALSVSLFFGQAVDASCNVNWKDFKFVSLRLLVVGFPALDVFSVFPINVVIAANNIMALAFPDPNDAEEIDSKLRKEVGRGSELELTRSGDSEKSDARGSERNRRTCSSSGSGSRNSNSKNGGGGGVGGGSGSGRALSAALENPWVRSAWRVGVALPSLALALVSWDLEFILALTGVVGMGIAFVLPALLHPRAQAACEHRARSQQLHQQQQQQQQLAATTAAAALSGCATSAPPPSSPSSPDSARVPAPSEQPSEPSPVSSATQEPVHVPGGGEHGARA